MMNNPLTNFAQSLAEDALKSTASSVVNSVVSFAKPRLMDMPEIDDDYDTIIEQEQVHNVPKSSPNQSSSFFRKANDKEVLSEEQVQAKAKNQSDVWAESLNMIQVASNLGAEFLELEKGDRTYLKMWDERIEEASIAGSTLALPNRYYEVKARIEEFETNLLSIKTESIPEEVRSMLYEGLYGYLKEQNENGGIKPYSKWEAITQAVVIILGNSFKRIIFTVITKALRKLN
jgi:hypothetical protein